MTSPALLRVLRLGGTGLLLGFMALMASPWVAVLADRTGRTAAGECFQVGGVICGYENDAVFLSGEGGERYTVLVSTSTVVRDGAMPASLAALRPGRYAIVLRGARRRVRIVSAETMMVWGGDPVSPERDRH